jgi:plasmid stabilization system protein ParE
MKKYTVIFHPDAETDIDSSYQWGCRVWGEKRAQAWARQLQRTIKSRLTSLPLSCSVAPESDELGIPIRQLIVHRYRVLFIVDNRIVTILHVRGPHVSKAELTRVKDTKPSGGGERQEEEQIAQIIKQGRSRH